MEHQPAQGGTRLKSSDTDGFMALDCGAGSPISEDLLNLSGLLNFDGLNESSSPLSPDLLFSFFNSSLHPIFGNSASSIPPCGLEQAGNSVFEDEGPSGDGVSRLREKLAAQKPILQSEFSMNLVRECELESVEKDVKGNSNIILKSIGNFTFSDRMLKALSLLKDSSGGGILAQVWMPVKQGDNYILSTSEQPFLLDHVLAGYREVSRVFTFSAKETPGMFPGVPGRVFISGLPEWTSNVLYYNKFEYLRVEHAISHDVRGSLAVPVFDPHQSKCRAVLELVTMKEKSNFDVEMENVCRALQVKYGLQKQTDKKRSTSEKHISLNVLQKYFAGSLKDAAKSLGVCPTTLKRICRQHGISRWPSRKIKKVNHSLKKIQSVINSVRGVEGTLQYDPKTGCLIAAVTPEKLSGDLPLSSSPQCGDRQFDEKLEGQRANVVSKLNLPKSHHSLTNEVPAFPNDCSTKSKVTFSNVEISRHTDIKGSLCSEDINLIARAGCIQDPTDNRGLQNFVPMSADSVAEEDEMDVKIGLNVGREHSHSSFSSMTDSSSESTSYCPTFKKNSKHESFVSYKGAVYTVKATYKSDTVRFKLLPSMGCLHLYEEVGKRFKLSIGTFQLKYMDDEEEWVLLTTDSDLQECIEVLESIASQSMKLQVRDVPCTVSAQPAVATC